MNTTSEGYGSKPYRAYVLGVLLLIYVLNFIDRGLLSVVARPLKAEIEVSDAAWGLLTGFSFAVFYSSLGIPLARIAERRNRVVIICLSLIVWSVMTAMCGMATEVTVAGVTIGSYWFLLLCRMGVGIGEAGCTPPANSLIADYFSPSARPAALGVYATGVMLGNTLANFLGGLMTDAVGWRMTFIVLGLPGVVVAAIVFFTVKEPPRGYTDPVEKRITSTPPLKETLKALFATPAYTWMCAGATLAGFAAYGLTSFETLYFQRMFDLSAGEAAVRFSTPSSAAGAAGAILIGWLAKRLSKSVGNIGALAALGLLVSLPFYALAFSSMVPAVSVAVLMAAKLLSFGYLTAQYAIAQESAPFAARATATAVLLFFINLLGYGFGPLFTGVLSDAVFAGLQQSAGIAGALTRSACDALQSAALDTATSVELLKRSGALTQAQAVFCASANAKSTQTAILATISIYGLAAIGFGMSARVLRKARTSGNPA